MIRRNRLFPFLIITPRVTIHYHPLSPFLSGMLRLHPGSKLCQFFFFQTEEVCAPNCCSPVPYAPYFFACRPLSRKEMEKTVMGDTRS